MAYDEDVAERIRQLLADVPGVTERKMFGGLCFMIAGNMAVGPINDSCLIRVGAEAYQAILAEGIAREMTFTGRPMRGIVQVDNAVLADDEALAEWVQIGIDYASSLPPK